MLLVFHADGVQDFVDLALRHVLEHGDDLQVFPAGQVSVVRGGFDERAGLPQDGQPVFGGDGHAAHLDGALVGLDQPQDQLHGGGLSRAVGPQEAVDAALRHFHVQTVHGVGRAVALGEGGGFDGCFHLV